MSRSPKLQATFSAALIPELLLAAALAIVTLWHVGLMFHALASTSLTTDEFGTIFSYSAKGPLHVMGEYDAAKNHVLFNLLNSITPGRESIEPLRARAYSFAAAVALIIAIAWFAIRERRYLEGALWLAIWGGSSALLEMSLLARGYGLLGLAAALSCLCAALYFQTSRFKWCIALGVLTALGTYAVPGYLFFGGPLLISLWLADRRWPVFWVGVASAGLILLLYAPLLPQLLHATEKFAKKDHGDFGSVEGIFRALRVYGVPGTGWQNILFYSGSLILAFALPVRRPIAPALRVIAVAVVAFFAAMLFLQTAPLRMASFAILPLSFCGLMAAGDFLRAVPNRLPACLAGLAGVIWLGTNTLGAIRNFDYSPIENWREAARAIDATFPLSVAIDYGNYGKYLKYYLTPGRKVLAGADRALFQQSRVVVVDAHRIWAAGGPSDARDFEAKRASANGVEIEVPGSIREIALNYAAPAGSLLPPMPPGPKEGVFTGKFSISTPAHALAAVFDQPIDFANVSASLQPSQTKPPISLKSLVIGNAIIVPLAGLPSGELTIEARDVKATPRATFLVPESIP